MYKLKLGFATLSGWFHLKHCIFLENSIINSKHIIDILQLAVGMQEIASNLMFSQLQTKCEHCRLPCNEGIMSPS